MNKEIIENIVSDCGYEALGIYSYLYSIRDQKYNTTIISMGRIADMGAYFDNSTLVESISGLKEFGYLYIIGNMYLFPKVEDYDDFFEIFCQVKSEEDLEDILKSNNDVKEILLKVLQANQDDKVLS